MDDFGLTPEQLAQALGPNNPIFKVGSGMASGLLDWAKVPGQTYAGEPTQSPYEWGPGTAMGMVGVGKLPGMGVQAPALGSGAVAKLNVPPKIDMPAASLGGKKMSPQDIEDTLQAIVKALGNPDQFPKTVAAVNEKLPNVQAAVQKQFEQIPFDSNPALDRNAASMAKELAIAEGKDGYEGLLLFKDKYGLDHNTIGNLIGHDAYKKTSKEINAGTFDPFEASASGDSSAIIDALAEASKKKTLMPEKIPEETSTWEIPPRGKDVGFYVKGHHGTSTLKPFTEFRLPEDEIGVHFGTPQAARDILGPINPTDYYAHRVYPAALRLNNPLVLRDLGTWGVDNMTSALLKKGFPEHEVGQLGTIQEVRDYIKSKGYDGIQYKNSVEDPGSTSYIMMDTSRIRSPFAKFAPENLHMSDLLAGLGGAGVVGAGVMGAPDKAAASTLGYTGNMPMDAIIAALGPGSTPNLMLPPDKNTLMPDESVDDNLYTPDGITPRSDVTNVSTKRKKK